MNSIAGGPEPGQILIEEIPMFIGHYGVALALKRAAPRTSLGTLFAASAAIDLALGVTILLGIEHIGIAPGITVVNPLNLYDYPYTHSLFTVVLWGIAAAALYFGIRKYRAGAVAVFAAVTSHWVLDLLTHIPDLPLYPGSDLLLGLGLWNSRPGTLVVETGIFIAGVILYLRSTRAAGKIGRYGIVMLLGLLLAVHIGNMIGTPPPNVETLALSLELQWLFVVLAAFVDRGRSTE